ncbi:MAG: hypothetical protein GX657_04120 [Chloroflexi bacterium]|nr:hypothetical protein [Chloroflexota bacterium]
MATMIDRFGAAYASATELPTLDGSQPQGAGPVASSLVRLPGGGAYDWRGSDRARREAETMRLKGVWVAESIAAMETKLAVLRALVGTRDRLWRSNGTAQHWRVARLLELKSDLAAGMAVDALLEFTFETLPGPWNGTARTVNATLDASPKTVACTNSGNLRVTDPVVTVTAAGSPITVVRVRVTGVTDLQWTGALAVGQSLVIDCGARTVRAGGADAYSGITYLSGHTVPEWLRLQPGANSVLIYRTGGSAASTAKVEYSDGWA